MQDFYKSVEQTLNQLIYDVESTLPDPSLEEENCWEKLLEARFWIAECINTEGE